MYLYSIPGTQAMETTGPATNAQAQFQTLSQDIWTFRIGAVRCAKLLRKFGAFKGHYVLSQ